MPKRKNILKEENQKEENQKEENQKEENQKERNILSVENHLKDNLLLST
jgi:hypothetical protein